MKKQIVSAIKFPKETEQEVIRDLNSKGEATIIGFGKVTVTRYRKKAAFLPKESEKGFDSVPIKKKFMRIGFKAAISLKRSIR